VRSNVIKCCLYFFFHSYSLPIGSFLRYLRVHGKVFYPLKQHGNCL
jgi:hypothetical protein